MARGVRREIVIECGAAETRAALIIDGEARGFWFGPARGDEALPRPAQAGAIHSGRVRSVSKALGGAFVDIGEEREAYLPFARKDAPPVEGALLVVKVKRPALAGKGAVLTRDWSKDLDASAATAIEARAKSAPPGALAAPADAALDAFAALAPKAAPDLVVASDAEAARLLRQRAAAPVRVEARPFRSQGLDEALARSLERRVRLDAGARLLFHETEAGAMIDVDSAEAAAGAGAKLNEKINAAAAARLFPELSRRAIGGRVIVDFLPPAGTKEKARLADLLREGMASTEGARFGKLSADGLCDFTLPRRRLSLLEEATEKAGADWPVAGRRLTLDWAAKAALSALEDALASRPSSAPRLVAAKDIAAYVEVQRPDWGRRLAERYGARFGVESSSRLDEREHEIIE